MSKQGTNGPNGPNSWERMRMDGNGSKLNTKRQVAIKYYQGNM